MTARKAGAAGRRAPDQAAERKHRGGILSELRQLGDCVSCGTRLQLVGGRTNCPTCGAWRRWARAHRVAHLAPDGR